MRYSQVILSCVICGNDFSVFAYRSTEAKFCGYNCYGEFRKTIPAPMKGKPNLKLRGENHPNWNTNREQVIRRTRKEINTLEYKAWRKEVFERHDYRCFDCGEKGGILQADHIYPWAKFPRLRYMPENGQLLCLKCHREKTHRYSLAARL